MDRPVIDANCSSAHEQISARLDGELSAEQSTDLDSHLAGCIDCASLEMSLTKMLRTSRLQPVAAIPDLSTAILARAHPPRTGRRQWIRWSLAAFAGYGVLRSVPVLLFGTEIGADIHVARHLGALNGALFIGLLFAAWRPVRAYGLLPMALALAATLLAGAFADTVTGHTHALKEFHHLIEIVSVTLLWMLAGSPTPGWLPKRHARTAPHFRTA